MRRVDEELNDLFSERGTLEKRVQNLKSFATEINAIGKKSTSMQPIIHDASLSAKDISSQVIFFFHLCLYFKFI